MNYLELLNAFYERIQCSRVSNNGQLLYHTLLMINNKSSWSDWFSRTNVSVSGLMNVSEKAFMNARAELKQLGLIDFIPSKKRGECTRYRILYPTNYSTKAGTNDSTKEVQTTVQSADINKLKQKTKTKKSIADAILEKCAQKSIPESVEESLRAYAACQEELGKPLTEAALDALLKRLEQLAPGNFEGQRAVLDQAIRKRWKDVYPLDKRDKGRDGRTNQFHNFDQRDTDYDAVVMERLKERLEGRERV